MKWYIVGLQMYQAGDTNRNTIVVYTSPLQLGPGDCIRITGVTQPITEYQNVFGATLSAPAIDAEHINKIDCSESIEPARMIINVDQTQEKEAIKVTLHKVEFSDKNTRVYLTIENTNLYEDITFYDFNSRAIQDKTQFITTTSFDVHYPNIESTIPQGIVENGVILFEPLNPTQPQVQFRFEANKGSDNVEFIFDINFALDYYKSILATDPNNIEALGYKGSVFTEQGNYSEAMESYDKALVIDPNNEYALRGKGIAFDWLGKTAEAIESFDRVVDIDPNNLEVIVDKGNVFAGAGNTTEAVKYYDQALAIDPNYLRATENKEFLLSE